MTGEGLKRYLLTDHARFEMALRGLSDRLVKDVLESPGQRWQIRPGRELLQSKV